MPPARRAAPTAPEPFLVTTSEPEEQASSLALLDQRYEQLSRGPFSGSLSCISVGRVTLFREALEQSVYQTGCAPTDRLTVAASCELSAEAYWNGRHIGNDAIITFAPGREFELISPRHAVCVGMSISGDDWMDSDGAASSGDWSRPLLSNDSWSDIGSARQKFSDHISAVLSALSCSPTMLGERAACEQLADELLGDLATRIDEAAGPAPRVRESSYPRIAQRARAAMLERIDEHVSVRDLCDATGCSRRSLQYAFESVFGVTPVAYLRTLRLNAVRRELRHPQPGTTVHDVAARLGFWHFPRFAQEYAKMFGELPSRTLSKCRAQA